MPVADMATPAQARTPEATPAPAGLSLRTFITSWQPSLEAAGKSPRTVRSYTDSVRAPVLLRYPRRASRPASERPPAPVPPLLRGPVASGRRLHGRPDAHHRLEDI